MRCVIRRHKWEIRGTRKYRDASFGLNLARTEILRRCERCGKLKTKTMGGFWTIEQLLPERGETPDA